MSIKRNLLLIGLLWSAVIVASLLWNAYGAISNQRQQARSMARSFFEQVLVTRQWNARHGGVYVPVTDITRPNPYLAGADRDIPVNSSLMLTKVNPAFMTRQIAEISEDQSHIRFHITSLNPIRPENRADEREQRALQRFERGVREVDELFEEGDRSYYFYMAPLVTEQSCLECHAEQGYRQGDIRGGISVTPPYDEASYLPIMVISHAAIGLLGLAGLALVGRQLNHSYNIIKRQAVMDALTGIPNRRSFSQSVLREFNRSRRENKPLSLLMCDIDHFKPYNDRYGHGAGDDCLKTVASTISAALRRPGDFCARYGGEEFVVILTQTDWSGALEVAERIRGAVEALAISHETAPPHYVITVSIGVAVLANNSIESYEQLIKRADEALYLAKDRGRNRVECYPDAGAAGGA